MTISRPHRTILRIRMTKSSNPKWRSDDFADGRHSMESQETWPLDSPRKTFDRQGCEHIQHRLAHVCFGKFSHKKQLRNYTYSFKEILKHDERCIYRLCDNAVGAVYEVCRVFHRDRWFFSARDDMGNAHAIDSDEENCLALLAGKNRLGLQVAS